MTKESLRIVFMGTPEFAVPSLKALVDHGFEVVGVITAPDKPAGRGQQIRFSAVKEYALSEKLTILQPTNLKDEGFLTQLRDLNANLQVVVAFRMLPEVVWNMPKLGTFNLHGSLLPNYRGAAPINWAIMNGEKETGCTTFFLQHEIDTGDIILQLREPIMPDDNVGTLYERLMHKGARLVAETATKIANGEVRTTPQDETIPRNDAPKIHKETCKIDWNKNVEDVHNFIRGLSPYPAAWCELGSKTAKIFKSSIVDSTCDHQIGAIISDNKTHVHFQTASGLLAIEELQVQGKKRMDTESFLRGNTI